MSTLEWSGIPRYRGAWCRHGEHWFVLRNDRASSAEGRFLVVGSGIAWFGRFGSGEFYGWVMVMQRCAMVGSVLWMGWVCREVECHVYARNGQYWVMASLGQPG